MIRTIDNGTFPDVLEYLQAALRHGPRAQLEEDFLPAGGYARRFIIELRVRLAAPIGSPDRAAGEHGLRLVMAVLSQRGTLPGRPVHEAPDAATIARVRMVRQMYAARLQVIWTDDRTDLRQAIDRMVPTRLRPNDQTTLGRLLRKPSIRASDVADFLTSVHVGLPVRRVRKVLHATPDTVIHA